MNALIIKNRGGEESGGFELPSDHWYQFEVPGVHLNRGTGVNQVIDDMAARSMVNRFNADKANWERDNDSSYPGMLIDFDHFSYDTSKSSVSAGWAMEMRAENRDKQGRLYPEAKIRWSKRGEAAVTGGDFRFFSTTYQPDDVAVLAPKRVRPLRVDRLALTNDPNNKGGKPISNRDDSGDSTNNLPAEEELGAAKHNEPSKTVMKETAKAFGLPEDSTDSVLANRAGEIITENADLKRERDELLEAQVEADLDKFKNRFHENARATWKTMLLQNRSAGIKLLEGTNELPKGKADEPQRIHNRGTAQHPEGTPGADDEPTEKDRAAAKAIRNRAESRAATEGIPFSEAFRKEAAAAG